MRHITVVYSIADETAFAAELNRVMALYAELGEKPWGITAISVDNEIRRMQLIEDAIEVNDFDIIPTILVHFEIGNVRSIDEL